ncbi:2-iminoacetate synthase ThiH [Zymobacter sp. IVIA_12111.31 C1]|uniref:2-iminoacetate synthase ThiH n=1 Tax=Zymobacter sp. IVIA_12111.31 C1 TaxID=3394854 RepID=UPI0039C0B8E6
MSRSFFGELCQLDWQDITLRINAMTAADVQRALTAPSPDAHDLMALISPAADGFLEQMAQRAQALSRQRFGSTIGMYVPLYLSNMCANNCSYCGFSSHNRITRKILSGEEIERECEAIKALGFDQVVIVTGEHPKKVGMAYFREHLPRIRRHFSHLMMEVQPMRIEDYAELRTLGVDTVLVYQETYHPALYDQHHLSGFKTDFQWRLETPDRLGLAGMSKIGLGALLGLSADWRTDCFMMTEHLRYLRERYWQSRFSISFPRLRPCEGGITPAALVTERHLVQLICAYRIAFPDVELSLSTRESARFRDHVAPLGITSISAFSQTQPGGYANTHDHHLEQFTPDDHRTPEQVADALRQSGLQPVWKDWDAGFGRQAPSAHTSSDSSDALSEHPHPVRHTRPATAIHEEQQA